MPHLARKGLLDAPPAAAEEPDGTRYVQWAAGEYLLRMAAASDAATRRQVAELLRNVAASENPDVQYRGLQILGALPPEESAPLADVAIGWLGREARFAIMPGREKLVEKLAEGKQPDAALRIAAFLLQTWDQGGQIATLYGQHMYEHHFRPSPAR